MTQRNIKILLKIRILFEPLAYAGNHLVKKNCLILGYFFHTLSGYWVHALSLYQSHILLTDETFGFSVVYIYIFSTLLWLGGFIALWSLQYYTHSVDLQES